MLEFLSEYKDLISALGVVVSALGIVVLFRSFCLALRTYEKDRRPYINVVIYCRGTKGDRYYLHVENPTKNFASNVKIKITQGDLATISKKPEDLDRWLSSIDHIPPGWSYRVALMFESERRTRYENNISFADDIQFSISGDGPVGKFRQRKSNLSATGFLGSTFGITKRNGVAVSEGDDAKHSQTLLPMSDTSC